MREVGAWIVGLAISGVIVKLFVEATWTFIFGLLGFGVLLWCIGVALEYLSDYFRD